MITKSHNSLSGLSPAAFLVQGLNLPALDESPEAAPPGTVCALTGERLEAGYRVQRIIPSSTGEWLDLLRGDTHGWLSETAARAVRGDWNLGNRAVFRRPDGAFDAYFPLLATPKSPAADAGAPPDTEAMSAKKLITFRRDGALPRPSWSALVREIWPARAGQECLLLLATDPKKRVWNRARVGRVGEQTPLLVFDNSRALLRPLTVSWPRLLETLETVEEVYTAGFTKRALAECLYREQKAAQAVGMPRTLAWEKALSALRSTPEFTVALIIAQRKAPTL